MKYLIIPALAALTFFACNPEEVVDCQNFAFEPTPETPFILSSTGDSLVMVDDFGAYDPHCGGNEQTFATSFTNSGELWGEQANFKSVRLVSEPYECKPTVMTLTIEGREPNGTYQVNDFRIDGSWNSSDQPFYVNGLVYNDVIYFAQNPNTAATNSLPLKVVFSKSEGLLEVSAVDGSKTLISRLDNNK